MAIKAADKARYEELCSKAEYYNKCYYVDDNPVVTDYEYDMLMRRLKQIEAENNVVAELERLLSVLL